MLSSAVPVRVHILDRGGVRIQVRSHENTVDFEVVTNNGSVLGSPFQNILNYLGYPEEPQFLTLVVQCVVELLSQAQGRLGFIGFRV